jgi:hypothetical protein
MRLSMHRLPVATVVFGLLFAGFPTHAAANGAGPDPISAAPGWAGYVVRAGGGSFEDIKGSWVQPKVVCNRPESSVAFWIGLGGATEDSEALEQIGTSAECSDRALLSTSAWYQLFPAPAVEVPLTIRPGDAVAAEVTVNRQTVTLALRNVSTGAAFSTELVVQSPETDSAEWIVEAPAACFAFTMCTQLPLADFDRVRFTDASTVAGPHAGPIGDQAWSRQRLVMTVPNGRRLAVPTSLSGGGSSFAVVCPKLRR